MNEAITKLLIRQITKLSQARLANTIGSDQSGRYIRALILEHREASNEDVTRPRSNGR